MNKERRNTLTAIAAKLRELQNDVSDFKNELEACRDEEQEYFDNMPESLQGGEKGAVSEDAISQMENALTSLENAESELEDAISGINDIINN